MVKEVREFSPARAEHLTFRCELGKQEEVINELHRALRM